MIRNKSINLQAYSNGKLIFLDLEKNLYLLSKNDVRDSVAEEINIKYAAGLRDNLSSPNHLLPSFEVSRHYISSLFLSRKYRDQTISKLLNMLRMRSMSNKKELIHREMIKEYSTLYQYLRNFLPWRPLCLEDSVCCFLFLSRFIRPLEFVIGVKYPPFAAHAWVESQNIVLNDKKIAVEDYSVILRYGI